MERLFLGITITSITLVAMALILMFMVKISLGVLRVAVDDAGLPGDQR